MPLYEYKCLNCGDVFEVMQKFADAPLQTHEKCGGPVERLISAPALQFKGSGFYLTDYGKGGSKPPSENGAAKKAESATEKGSGKSEAASTSSPASSSESKTGSSESKSSPSTSSSDSK